MHMSWSTRFVSNHVILFHLGNVVLWVLEGVGRRTAVLVYLNVYVCVLQRSCQTASALTRQCWPTRLLLHLKAADSVRKRETQRKGEREGQKKNQNKIRAANKISSICSFPPFSLPR